MWLVNAASLTKRDVAACVSDLAAIDAEVNTLNTIVSYLRKKKPLVGYLFVIVAYWLH
jgi:hypothetical protein